MTALFKKVFGFVSLCFILSDFNSIIRKSMSYQTLSIYLGFTEHKLWSGQIYERFGFKRLIEKR